LSHHIRLYTLLQYFEGGDRIASDQAWRTGAVGSMSPSHAFRIVVIKKETSVRWLIYPPLIVVALPLLAYGVTAALVGRDQVWSAWLGPVERTPVDFDTLQPGPEPHWFLVCPPNHCQDVRQMEAPVFDLPVADLQAAFLALVAGNDLIQPIDAPEATSGTESLSRQFSFEARTPVLRFPDTVTVRFYDVDGDRSSLAIYSRSHYGYSDLGKNEDRVRSLLADLQAAVRS